MRHMALIRGGNIEVGRRQWESAACERGARRGEALRPAPRSYPRSSSASPSGFFTQVKIGVSRSV
jgi:hypothetical protein